MLVATHEPRRGWPVMRAPRLCADGCRAACNDRRRALVSRALRAHPGARRAVHDVERRAGGAALHARGRGPVRGDRLPGRVSVHARRVPVDVSRAALDDAPVRGLRDGGGDERALPLPARPRADGAVDGVRHAVADGPRLRPRALGGRGRPRGRGDRHARRHGDAVRRDRHGRGLDLDDDQRAGGGDAGVLRGGGGAAGHRAGAARGHDPDGHPEGVHRAEGVVLPGRPGDAARDRHDRVLRPADAAGGTRSRSPATTSARPARRRSRSLRSR